MKKKVEEIQRHFSAFGEGYGTKYERFALNNFICEMVERYDITTVLEMPADGVMGIPGINSLIFAKLGCEVTVVHPSKEFLDNAKKIWDAFGLDANFVKSHWLDSKFDENSFDLVWNFCVYGHFDDPKGVVREMLRVTKRYIFIEFQNIFNPGFHIHRLQHFLKKEPWDHGEPSKLRFSNVKKTIEELKGMYVEEGGIDMPPWPDIPINLKGTFHRGTPDSDLSNEVDKESFNELRPKVNLKNLNEIVSNICDSEVASEKTERTLRLFNIWYNSIEKKAPFPIKKAYAHHLYIMAEKRR